jgi:pilus assembly protein Flp/PilA
MKTLCKRFIKDESGATAIEYGLIAALVAVAIIAALNAMTGQLNAVFGNITKELTTAAKTPTS